MNWTTISPPFGGDIVWTKPDPFDYREWFVIVEGSLFGTSQWKLRLEEGAEEWNLLASDAGCTWGNS